MICRPKHFGAIAAIALLACAAAAEVRDPAALVADLASPDATIESRATQALLAMGQPAVPALADFAISGKSFAGRMLAVELLGKIGTAAASDALLDLLRNEKNLALRGQIVMHLGYLREQRAVPLIAQWLKTIGPNAINDVPGGKEFQPSTCYLRHIEALAMIGDMSAVPMLEEFEKKIPQGIGYGGFISNFVKGGVSEALEELNEKAGIAARVRAITGLDKQVQIIFEFCRRDPVARFRLYEDQIIRHTDEGKKIAVRLSSNKAPAVAAAAKAILEKWDEIGK